MCEINGRGTKNHIQRILMDLDTKLSLKKHALEKIVYDNVPHSEVSIMDVDALYTYYKTPDKPQIAVEYKNQNEKLRPTQWFNLPRLEKEYGLDYCILRYLNGQGVSFERVDSSNYLATRVLCVTSEEEGIKILSSYARFKKIINLAKNN